MSAYKILLPGCALGFTYITTESPEAVPDAIFERFGVYPEEVTRL